MSTLDNHDLDALAHLSGDGIREAMGQSPTRPTFTPGPWDFAADSYGKVQHSRKACVFLIKPTGVQDVAARIPNWADARLIAAAPEMYYELRELVALIAAEFPTQAPTWLTNARAALAKADGR